MQKNGGNVASYFCTDELRVIHAAGGPISADELLKRARWAVDTANRAWEFAAGKLQGQKEIVAQAHLYGLKKDLKWFTDSVRRELPSAERDFARYAGERRERARSGARPSSHRHGDRDAPDAMTLARWRVADRIGGEQAHRLLAADPLAAYGQVRRRMFEKLTGERFNTNRRPIYVAAEMLKRAREQGNPVMLVLYKSHGQDDTVDPLAWLSRETLFRQEAIARPLSAFIVVPLPLRQFSALTQLVDLPNYRIDQKASRTLILADHQGKQVETISGLVNPNVLAKAMWPLINNSRLARAELLAEQDKLAAAAPFLERILSSPASQEMRDRARRRLLELNDRRAERFTSEGKTREAMRMFGRMRQRVDDAQLHRGVSERLAALRETLQ
ncbi:MAG: hypothetical protein IIA67_12795 [Planctomycetes bacterium]|nr:hypothetical protein [Planctomycetota bacterium]